MTNRDINDGDNNGDSDYSDGKITPFNGFERIVYCLFITNTNIVERKPYSTIWQNLTFALA